jgi:hypothetical protein
MFSALSAAGCRNVLLHPQQQGAMTTIIDEKTQKPWMEHGYVGDFAVREFERGMQPHDGHAHWIDHLTVFYRGPVRLTKKHEVTGEVQVVEIHKLPWVLNIEKDWHHTVEALTENGAGWFCIFSGAQADAQVISRDDFNYERLTHG